MDGRREKQEGEADFDEKAMCEMARAPLSLIFFTTLPSAFLLYRGAHSAVHTKVTVKEIYSQKNPQAKKSTVKMI